MNLIDKIIAELGGSKAASLKLDVHPQSFRYWKERGVPRDYWRKIMRLTNKRVTLEALFKTTPNKDK